MSTRSRPEHRAHASASSTRPDGSGTGEPVSGGPSGAGAAFGGASAPDAERLLGERAAERAALVAMLEDALARGVEHVHVERADDAWRLRHRDDESLHETRLGVSDRLPAALALLAEHAVATGAGRVGGALVLTCRAGGQRVLLELRRTGTVLGEDFLVTLHGNALVAPRLDALGADPAQLGAVRALLDRPTGWLVVGSGGALAGERLVRALAQELVSPERKLLSFEPRVHPPLAGVSQVTDESALPPHGAADVDVALLAATPPDERLAALAPAAAERLLVVQRCTARRPSTALRRLLALGLSPSWIALVCPAVLMHHRVRLVCPACRRRTSPEAALGLDATEAPPVRDVAAWLERSLRGSFEEGAGCVRCDGTGHVGTRDLLDLVVLEAAVREALVRGEIDAALLRVDAGGTLGTRLARLIASGEITRAEASRHVATRG